MRIQNCIKCDAIPQGTYSPIGQRDKEVNDSCVVGLGKPPAHCGASGQVVFLEEATPELSIEK